MNRISASIGPLLLLASATIPWLLLPACRSAPQEEDFMPTAPDRFLVAALRTADWLEAVAIRSEHGTDWPAVPSASTATDDTLYHGNPGVVLFFLEAHRATGNRRFLDIARSGADALLARLSTTEGLGDNGGGLYTGLAGIGFVLAETYRATDDARYREGVVDCVDRLYYHATAIDEGSEWNDSTDVISGTAGIGFFLLYAERAIRHPDARNLATRAGIRLLELGDAQPGGKRWTMNPTFPRYMPNFSHGTAGVASYLAALHDRTDERRFLQAAQEGASHLVRIANTADSGCRIGHHSPDGEDLYYLGWCHGPVGTARLFHQLYEETENPLWLDWTRRCAASLLNSGIPEAETSGFWNNVGQCCGTAGVLEFYLDLFNETGEQIYLDAARDLGDQLLREGIDSSQGLSWTHAENRTRPDEVSAQTGYMQGAAGIGIALLHLSAAISDRPDTSIRLPDSPFDR